MKAVVFTDLHIHPYKKFDNNGSRLKNCIQVLIDVFELAVEVKADCILFAGDMFDQQKSIPTEVINKIVKVLKMLFAETGLDMYAISGNHDQATQNIYGQKCVTALEFLDTVFLNFHLIDNQLVEIKGATVLGMPYYQYADDMYKAIDGRTADILLMHQTPEGISNPNIHTDFNPDDLGNFFDKVLCGHIHKPQTISPNFKVLGSPLHRDFGDVGDTKGIYVYDTETKKLQFLALDYPQFAYGEGEETDYVAEEILTKDDIENVESAQFTTAHSPQDLLNNYINTINENSELVKTGAKCL